MRRSAVLAAVALTGAAAVPASAAPLIDQLVVFRDGTSASETVKTRKTKVRAGGRRCRVPGSTPLAGLVRSDVRRVRVRDFSGSCDPSSLFVQSIAGEANRGQRGWVYKVGNRQATIAASDPSGPFGAGALKRRVRVTWFYCVFAAGGCQRTLGLRLKDQGGGNVAARVTAYDDEGRGSPVAGADVLGAGTSATTDSRGRVTLMLGAGRHRLRAEKRGHVRSFNERITLR